MEKIVFQIPETGEETKFYVIEETRFHGKNYLLVTEASEEEEEAEAYILKDLSEESDTEADYRMVEDEIERKAVTAIFSELLEDVEIEEE